MQRRAGGFTLIELLVAMLVTLVILGALVLTFRTQYGIYKFQHRKADAVQDAEIVLETIRDDIENALLLGGAPVKLQIVPVPPVGPSKDLRIVVWEPDLALWASQAQAAAAAYRAERHYRFVPGAKSLRLDRNVNDGNDRPVEILGNVAFFQVWPADQPPSCAGGGGYRDAPPAPANPVQAANTYVVLLELEVPVGTRAGVKRDHCNQATRTPRVLRYIQAAPAASMDMP